MRFATTNDILVCVFHCLESCLDIVTILCQTGALDLATKALRANGCVGVDLVHDHLYDISMHIGLLEMSFVNLYD